MTKMTTAGKRLADRFEAALRAFRTGGAGGDAPPVIWGVTPQGVFVDGATPAAFLAQAREVLAAGDRVFRYGNALVLAKPEPDGGRLVTLAVDQTAEPRAAAFVSHLFSVGARPDAPQLSLPPERLVRLLLADDGLWAQAPAIATYARRPVFDAAFALRGPGWHPGGQVLVHGPHVDAAALPPPAAGGARLPPLLHRLLAGFCWAAPADLANAVAALLTGVLANHFVDEPKPVLFVDGNREGVGKTLLVQVIGQVLDGQPAPTHRFTDDDELEKRLAAQVKDGGSSVLFIDNVRLRGGGGKIDSPFLEANALAATLTFRLLGQTAVIRRPNAYLWAITANQTTATADLIDRSLPVRLRFEGGDPKDRPFAEDPLALARDRRLDLLGELYGMVLAWRHAGAPAGAATHRCGRWAAVVGGILQAAGLPDFLANATEAETAMDADLQALAAVAEYVWEQGVADAAERAGAGCRPADGRLPADWVPLFRAAQVGEELDRKPARGQASWVGHLLSKHVGRRVPLAGAGAGATAVVHRKDVRSGQKRYFFRIDVPAGGEAVAGGETFAAGEAVAGTRPPPEAPAPAAARPIATVPPPAPVDGGNGLEWV